MADNSRPKLNPIVVALIAGNMQALGITLETMDANSTGKDDVIGMLLVAGSEAFQGFVQSNDGKLDRALIAIHKSTGSYLTSRGIEV